MHTDVTLNVMDGVTTALGTEFRDFQMKVCPAYATRELKREEEARKRRQIRTDTSRQATPHFAGNNGRTRKIFNVETYKFHALGDYVETIRRYGTTDSYSTELVSPISSMYTIIHS
jgi:hypothetical protein